LDGSAPIKKLSAIGALLSWMRVLLYTGGDYTRSLEGGQEVDAAAA